MFVSHGSQDEYESGCSPKISHWHYTTPKNVTKPQQYRELELFKDAYITSYKSASG